MIIYGCVFDILLEQYLYFFLFSTLKDYIYIICNQKMENSVFTKAPLQFFHHGRIDCDNFLYSGCVLSSGTQCRALFHYQNEEIKMNAMVGDRFQMRHNPQPSHRNLSYYTTTTILFQM